MCVRTDCLNIMPEIDGDKFRFVPPVPSLILELVGLMRACVDLLIFIFDIDLGNFLSPPLLHPYP